MESWSSLAPTTTENATVAPAFASTVAATTPEGNCREEILPLSLSFTCHASPSVTTFSPSSTRHLPLSAERLHPLQLEAVPDYPVAAGQRVDLHCSSPNATASVTWSWQRLQNENWTAVASGQSLTLTEPQQSGRYRCLARLGWSQERESTQHAVLIVSVPAPGRCCPA